MYSRRDSLIYSYCRAIFYIPPRVPLIGDRNENRGNARDNNEPRRYPARNNSLIECRFIDSKFFAGE